MSNEKHAQHNKLVHDELRHFESLIDTCFLELETVHDKADDNTSCPEYLSKFREAQELMQAYMKERRCDKKDCCGWLL